MGKDMEVDKGVFFREKTAKAIMDMQPNPSEVIPSLESATKLLSILACRPNTTTEIEHEHAREQAEKETKKQGPLGRPYSWWLGTSGHQQTITTTSKSTSPCLRGCLMCCMVKSKMFSNECMRFIRCCLTQL